MTAYRLEYLANRFGCQLYGDPDICITSVCTLQNGKPNAISHLTNPKYSCYMASTKASAVILKAAYAGKYSIPVLVHPNPHACYARVAALLSRENNQQISEIHPSAVIHKTASLGTNVTIGAHCFVGENTTIGDNCYIGPGVTLSAGTQVGAASVLYSNVSVYRDCVIGQRAILHSGVVIGADGFGFAQDNGEWIKVPQLGSVIIGDDVEVGANTTIDRGAIGDTIIEDGVKLDNQVQIGHNVHLGQHTLISGCVGIAGSATIGKHCTIGGGAGINGHIEVADNVHITAKSVVLQSITKPGTYSSGTPLQPNSRWRRNFVLIGQLNKIIKGLKKDN